MFLRRLILPFCLLYFIAAGYLFIPYAGIQNDEALFATAIYNQLGISDKILLYGAEIPLMLMSYLGALKTWIYAPMFKLWSPSTVSLRLPVLFLGAITIGLFWRLLARTTGRTGAAIGSILLATDALYLMTTVYDWGPVALEHFLLVSAAGGLVEFYHSKSRGALFLSFFAFGLALWDKAIFIWVLTGLCAGAVTIFPREIWRCVSGRNIAAALAGLLIGAAPLVWYNIRYPLDTFRSNTRWDASEVAGKTRHLRATLEGEALFGYLVRDEDRPREPSTPLERASVWLSRSAAGTRAGLAYYALLAAFAALPWLWRSTARRTMLFCLIAFLTGWGQMLLTKGAGGSVHHVILLWPLPHFLLAAAGAEAARRFPRVIGLAVALVAGSNVIVTNEHLSAFIRSGPGVVWTDALLPLSHRLSSIEARTVFIVDWGILDPLLVLSEGRLPVRPAQDSDPAVIRSWLETPDAIYVGHTEGNEQSEGARARLQGIAAQAGFRRQILAEIPDRNGRPIFEVVRFVRSP